MTLTLKEALSKIGTEGYTGVEGLQRLVGETSAVARNATANALTLLYSGSMGDIQAWQAAVEISNHSFDMDGKKQVVTIADTEVASLLEHSLFQTALLEAVGGSQEEYLRIMDGKDLSYNRTSNDSLWDRASKMMARSAPGDFLTLTPNALENSVFSKSEFTEILSNPELSNRQINGLSVNDLQRLQSDLINKGLAGNEVEANRMILEHVNRQSALQSENLKFQFDLETKKLSGIGSKEYFDKLGLDSLSVERSADLLGRNAEVLRLTGTVMEPESLKNFIQTNELIKSYQQERIGILEAAGDLAGAAEAGKALSRANAAGIVMGLLLIGSEAMAAGLAGDSERAHDIISEGLTELAKGAAVFGGIELAAIGIGAAIGLPIGAFVGSLLLVYGSYQAFQLVPSLVQSLNDLFISARNWIQRRDPLTLDLDGDGLETVGIDPNAPILFDHDGDGVANATGWIKRDDGFLILDRNGNGLIDNGSELFGDSTPLSAGGTAADGFAALAQEDSNGDGLVNFHDASWNDLRVWRDLNSDGVSQDGELFTLEALGIAGIHVAKSENTTRLADGNQIADLGSYIRTDGTEGTVGQVTGALADIDLVDNPFYREFSDTVPLTEQAQTLPDLQGSGRVRDLREAVSLSPALGNALVGYAAADTKAGQMALIDALISQWALSSGFQTSIEKAAAQDDRLLFLVPGLTAGDVLGGFIASGGGSGGENSSLGVPTAEEKARLEALKAQQIRITEILGILEKFNGMTFVNIEPDVVHTGANLSIAPADTSTLGGTTGLELGSDLFVLTLSTAQIGFIEQAYAALRQSVYDGLLLQTRLKPYMDAVKLAITEAGIGLDFTGTTTLFQTRYDQAPGEAVRDLLDLQRITGTNLNGSGWDGYEQLRGWLVADAVNRADTELSAKLVAALTEFGYSGLRTQGDGATANDVVIGAENGAVLHGEGGNDLILGGAGDDMLNGGTGIDTLYGGMGSDTYVFNLGDGADTIIEMNGDTGTDTLQFGDGIRAGDLDIFMDGDKLVFAHINGKDRLTVANWFGSLADGAHRLDTVTFADGAMLQLDALQLGSVGNDTLIGTSNSDILMGGAGDDILISDGNDWLNGGSGADAMSGSIGDDIYVIDNAGDAVIELEGEGNDTIDARVSYTLGNNVENMRLMGASSINGTGNELDNVITGNAADNILQGMAGSDTLIGSAGNDTLDGGLGADIMTGGTGNDVYIVDTLADALTEQAGEGIDTVKTDLGYTLGMNLENLILTGINAVDGTGNELNNMLTGNAADNILSGLAGNDILDGGLGADTLIGGIGNDTYIVDNTDDLVIEDAAEGIDTVKSSITYTLTDNVENLTLTGTASINGTGNVLDNIFIGNDAANTLTGLEGNDTLDGKDGGDTLIGGTGNDTYVVDDIGDAVQENVDEGIDTVQSSIGYTLGANLENLTLIGGSAIDGTGNELDNRLTGNGAVNILDGGLGADSMAGGAGNDIYILDNLGDTVTEYAWQGTDTVVSPFDYTLGVNVENLTLTEGTALTGTGNELDNAFTGNSNDNTLTGLAGKDTLDGGLGIDMLIGGIGNDTYIVDTLLDTALEAEGEGIDTIKSDLTWILAANLDNLTLTGAAAIDGTGNLLDNVIIGNAADNTLTALEGNDTLDGGAGADTLLGGMGNDTYAVDNTGDWVIESVNEGTDTVKSSITYMLTDNVENLALTDPALNSGLAPANIDGTGNVLDNILFGNSGNNTLTGLEGNDTLDGGAGADTLIGGTGDDSYVVDNVGDVVVELVGEGVDSVKSSISYTLTGNVEHLTLTGTTSIDGTGNAQDNSIAGNSGNNRLDGGAGVDVLAGGAGNDTYIVDNTADAVIELAGAGTDSVFSSADYALSDNVEILTLTGTADINAIGNALDNTLAGNSADNLLIGLAGNDTLNGDAGNDRLDGGTGIDKMTGGTGNDIYMVDNSGDGVTENLAEGTDTVLSSISYTLGDNLENLTLTGTSAIDGTGNELGNILIGNDAANILDGGLGVDVMAGGAGNDLYTVDNIGDVITEYVDEGTDTVQSSISYILADNVENLVLVGENLDGTGNMLDNNITGTGGNNVLNGGMGMDAMAGGAGNDTYIVDNTADAVIELTGEGTDSAFASADYALSGNIENLTLIGTAAINGSGNALDNLITGNDADNILNGMAGDDTLNGGAGVDTLIGGAGNDIYTVDNTTDVVMENLNEGTDSVFASATYTLSGNIENLILTGTAGIDGTGNTLNNIITGNSGSNRLDGGAGADTMTGGAGNDAYIVDNAGDKTVEVYNAGIDTVFSSVSHTLASNVENLTITGAGDIDATGNELNNILVGNTGNNRLYGLAGNDTLTGDIGNDLIDGGVGADSMAGNAGDDTYIVDNASDAVTENADEGLDTVQSTITYTLGANVENLTLTGGAAINGTGNELDNVIAGNAAANVLNGGLGADSMSGGAGNDTYVVDNIGDIGTEGLNAGTDLVQSSITYTLTDNVENLTLTGAGIIDGTGNGLNNIVIGNAAANVLDGGAGADTLHAGAGDDSLIGGDDSDALNGEAGNDQLQGNAGNDALDGGLGADSMSGGAGNDTYVVDHVGDLVAENLNEGIDLVQSSITYTLTDNVENLTLTGTANTNGTGNALDNIFLGNSGNNTLTGLEGNDTLNGGAGADTMLGGIGNDTYVVDNNGDLVIESLNEGVDLVQSGISYTLTDNVEHLALTGTASINGTGNALDNVIVGNTGSNTLAGLDGNDTLTSNAGNDTLDGGTGADSLAGGAGNDTYIVDHIGDLVTEAVNAGIDWVKSGITYMLTDNVENLNLTGEDTINGTGNALNNIITGNVAANVLDGGAGADSLSAGAGDDTLLGGVGNDILDGGTGADLMQGGLNNDIYIVDNSGDLVIENLNEGVDLVQSGITYSLTDNVENLSLTGSVNIDGTGNALDNIILGNSGNNRLTGLEGNDTLNGGLGADTMLGGVGDDIYLVENTGDVIIENPGEGIDNVQSSISYTLTDNVENLALSGTASINGTGNALNNVIAGNTGNNILAGLTGNDSLTGNVGNDTLDGGRDADTMAGGAGNDTYIVDHVGDLVTEALNAGVDTAQSSISYTLGANVENLSLTGTDAINGTGNTLNNTITGNAAANVLDGGAGADSMTGGAGNDIYIVDNAGDVVTEALAAGIDIVQSSITYTLGTNVENLALTGMAAINGTGNGIDNTIIGNNAVNVLDGGLGADTMQGGASDDIYIVDNTGDVVIEGVDAGTDTVQSNVTYTLSGNVENLSLTGTADINGTGNALDNVIMGNSGVNVLAGLEGNDTYSIKNTEDVIVENAGEGADSVFATATYTLSDNVENLTLTGTTTINGTGNALDNILTGNSGVNVLDGGLGADTMAGGAGNDIYIVDNAGDVVTEALNAGIDTTQSSISYTLASNVENLVLTGTEAIDATGNALDNGITGNARNNLIDGGIGADRLAGGGGNDTYVVENNGDLVIESLNEGTDLVQSGISYMLTDNVENLILDGSTNINGTGNAWDNMIVGNSGDNILAGMAGNDTLDGGVGADRLDGGLGDDTYIIDNMGDVGVEAASAGIDTVQSSVSYMLSDNIENLTLIGTIGINATGNTLDNILNGNKGANVLDGDAGADTLIGGRGNDTLLGGAGNDRYVFNPGDGTDVIKDVLGSDTLYIGGGLIEANLEGVRDGDNMIVNIFGTSETITLTNWFVQSEGVNRIEFSDGSSLDRTGIVGLLNRPPVANPDAITVFEDGGVMNVPTTALLTNDADPNANDVISIIAVGASTIGASVSLTSSTGSWQGGQVQYDIGDRFQELGAGQTVIDSFGYTISDSKGETASSLVTVTITGMNDAPVTTVDTVTVQEDLIVSATGNVLSNDTDVDQRTVLSVVDPGLRIGSYGSLTLGADGSYTYSVDNTSSVVQSLGRTAQLSEHFGYTVTDGIVGVASALDVYLNGTNDTPILVAPLADQDITFNKLFSWQMPSGSFIDIDQGDTLDYSATLADGSSLPNWLNFDSVAQTFSGMAPKTVGDVDIQVTATDRVAATGSTVDSLIASDIFRISISHGNEGVGNGQDSAPAGTGSNFNDGPGTSPGNPGAGGGHSASNILLGTEGNDRLTGSSGDDLFEGNGENDRLEGGAGNDIYLFGRNGGMDTVIKKDAAAGNTDVLRFGENIANEQVWFRRVGSDLEASFIGTDDKVIVNNWYKGSAYHVEHFQTADGKMLLDSQVENLVSAMAAFSPPAAGQTSLPQNYQDALAPVLAANWK
ncbi:MAG: calcium-binding protein [Methylomicrobium sp.]